MNWLWLDEPKFVAIHTLTIAAQGGLDGLRDPALLQSAIARPQQHVTYSGVRDVPTIAAWYVIALVRNHAFIDGNKRVGFLAGAAFLELNGYDFVATEAEAAQAVLELAAGSIGDEGFIAFFRDRSRRHGSRRKGV